MKVRRSERADFPGFVSPSFPPYEAGGQGVNSAGDAQRETAAENPASIIPPSLMP